MRLLASTIVAALCAASLAVPATADENDSFIYTLPNGNQFTPVQAREYRAQAEKECLSLSRLQGETAKLKRTIAEIENDVKLLETLPKPEEVERVVHENCREKAGIFALDQQDAEREKQQQKTGESGSSSHPVFEVLWAIIGFLGLIGMIHVSHATVAQYNM